MVDDEIDWLQRVDTLRIATELGDRVAHGGEVDDRGDAGEILKQDARSAERDLLFDSGFDVPAGHRFDIRAFDERVVFVAQQILEKNLEREGQAVGGTAIDRAEGIEAEDRVARAADAECGAAAEAVR